MYYYYNFLIRNSIPAHISELINHHLESERENFIHQMLGKLSTSEVEISKLIEANNTLSKKISLLEKEIHFKNQVKFSYLLLLE
jgi:hypothetical protein